MSAIVTELPIAAIARPIPARGDRSPSAKGCGSGILMRASGRREGTRRHLGQLGGSGKVGREEACAYRNNE